MLTLAICPGFGSCCSVVSSDGMVERHVDEDDEDDDVIDEASPRIIFVPVRDTRFTLITRCK